MQPRKPRAYKTHGACYANSVFPPLENWRWRHRLWFYCSAAWILNTGKKKKKSHVCVKLFIFQVFQVITFRSLFPRKSSPVGFTCSGTLANHWKYSTTVKSCRAQKKPLEWRKHQPWHQQSSVISKEKRAICFYHIPNKATPQAYFITPAWKQRSGGPSNLDRPAVTGKCFPPDQPWCLTPRASAHM